MSWDLFIQSIPAKYTSMAAIPEGFTPKPLGAQAKVIKAIRAVLPGILFEHGFAAVESKHGTVEIDIGHEDPVACVALFCRGNEGILPLVRALVKALGGRAFDTSSDTGIFDPDAAALSLGTANAHRAEATAPKKPAAKKTKKVAKKPAAKRATTASKKKPARKRTT